MRLRLRTRVAIGRRVPQPRGTTVGQCRVIAMVTGLLAGVALLSTGLVLNMLAMMIGGAALTQLSLVALARSCPDHQAARRSLNLSGCCR
jgi:hypothetical protein